MMITSSRGRKIDCKLGIHAIMSTSALSHYLLLTLNLVVNSG